ncbi:MULTISPECIES: peptide deformylase [Ferrimonas]|uniref:peptide deformylase n=1 Tax=Ferrimonas TaxID=44011 RepID=UPI0004083F95|nr:MULTISPECIES: peptide deformylase [Ferrimonas]
MMTDATTPPPLTIALLGEAVLRQPVRQLSLPSDEARSLSERMLQLMLSRSGVGIAAPQVHHSLALMIIASRPNVRYPQAPVMAPLVMVNPRLLNQAQACNQDWEGCLSVPGIRGLVSRPDWVEVAYQDLDGGLHQRRLEGFVARIFCHEYDHLQGLTFLDRVDNNRNLMATEVLARQMEQP